MTLKVNRPGLFEFHIGADGTPTGRCSFWDMTGSIDNGATPGDGECNRQILVAALQYIADLWCGGVVIKDNGVAYTPEALPENFDAEREALDAIAIARWRDE